MNIDIFEMIERAKESEFGATWFSEVGAIHISKEGNLTPIKFINLPWRNIKNDYKVGLDIPPLQ